MPELDDDFEDFVSPAKPARKPLPSKIVHQPVGAQWSLDRLPEVETLYQSTFKKRLPLANGGQGSVHNRLGWDHRMSADVSLNPSTPEGQQFIEQLKTAKVPFLAFSGAIPGVSTGPHIHLGFPSQRSQQRFNVGAQKKSKPKDDFDQYVSGQTPAPQDDFEQFVTPSEQTPPPQKLDTSRRSTATPPPPRQQSVPTRPSGQLEVGAKVGPRAPTTDLRQAALSGVQRGLGTAVKTAGGLLELGQEYSPALQIARSVGQRLGAPDPRKVIREKVSQPLQRFGSSIEEDAAVAMAKHQGEGFKTQLAQSLASAAGGTAVDLPRLAAGGVLLGPANLPAQFAAERQEEGLKGQLRGAGEGLVYHFGMGATAPLGVIRNALIWGPIAAAQSAGEQALTTGEVNPVEVLSSGLTMGTLAGAGGRRRPERVKVRDAQGRERIATPSDVEAIRQKKLTVVPPKGLNELQRDVGAGAQPEARVPASPTIPERPETIAAQVEAVKQGTRDAMLVPPGTQRPRVSGLRAQRTREGTFYYDPKRVSAETIQQKVADGTFGELLGHVAEKPELGEPTAVVTARTPEGVEVQSSAVPLEKAVEQARATQAQNPEAEIEVGGPEVAQKVIAERTASPPEVASSPTRVAKPEQGAAETTRVAEPLTLYRSGRASGKWWSTERPYAEDFQTEGRPLQERSIDASRTKMLDTRRERPEFLVEAEGVSEKQVDQVLTQHGYDGMIIGGERGEPIYKFTQQAVDKGVLESTPRTAPSPTTAETAATVAGQPEPPLAPTEQPKVVVAPVAPVKTADIALDDPRVQVAVEQTSAVQFAKRAVARAETEVAERQKIADEAQRDVDETVRTRQEHLLGGRKHELKKAQALLKGAQKTLEEKQAMLTSERRRKSPLARIEVRKALSQETLPKPQESLSAETPTLKPKEIREATAPVTGIETPVPETTTRQFEGHTYTRRDNKWYNEAGRPVLGRVERELDAQGAVPAEGQRLSRGPGAAARKSLGPGAASQAEDFVPVKERKFGKRFVEDERMVEELRESIGTAKYYEVAPNKITAEQAKTFVDKKGLGESWNAVRDEANGMPFHVRSVIGQGVIQRLNRAYKTLKDSNPKAAEYALDRATDMAEWQMDYGTRLGQGVQSFAIWARLTPEGKLLTYKRAVEKARKKHQQFNETEVREVIDTLNKPMSDEHRLQELNKLFKTNKTARKSRPDWQKLIDAAKKGKLTDKLFYQITGDKLGLPAYNKEIANRITELAELIDQAPEGMPKDKAIFELNKFIAQQKGFDPSDLPIGIYYGNILSGYNTHIVNSVDTALNVISEINGLAMNNPRAAAKIYTGLFRGLGEGKLDAILAMTKGRMATDGKWLEVPKLMEIAEFGKKGGVPISPATRAGRVTKTLAESKIAYPLNAYKYITRLLAASDAVWFRGAKEARASLLANRMADAEGLKGDALDARVRDILALESRSAFLEQAKREGFSGTEAEARAAELVEMVRDKDLSSDAADFAGEATYNHKPHGALGYASEVMGNWAQKYKALKLFVPFTRIVANVTNRGLNYTPYGFKRGFAGYSHGEKLSPEARRLMLTRATLGTIGLTTLGAMQAGGLLQIHGAGPSDREKKRQLQGAGWRPYSIQIGDKYISYVYTPIGLGLSILGNMTDSQRYHELEQKDAATRGAYAVARLGSTVFSQSFLSGLNRLFNVLSEQPGESITAVKQVLSGTVSAITTPNLVRDVYRLFDNKAYQSNTLMEDLVRNTPFAASMGLKPQLNAFGEPIRLQRQRFLDVLTSDPAWRFVIQKGLRVPVPSRTAEITKDRRIDPKDYYELISKTGPRLKQWVNENKSRLESMTEQDAQEELSQASGRITRDEMDKLRARLGVEKPKKASSAFTDKFLQNQQRRSRQVANPF